MYCTVRAFSMLLFTAIPAHVNQQLYFLRLNIYVSKGNNILTFSIDDNCSLNSFMNGQPLENLVQLCSLEMCS